MPVHTGKDSEGCYAQYGGQTKYYYECGNTTAQAAAEAKAAKQGRAAHANMSMILQLQTMPAVSMATKYVPKELVRYRKELVKVGHYMKASTNQAFEVTLDTLHHWATTFHRWIKNGNKVPLVPGHDRADSPEMNQGWVTNVFVEGNSLFGVLELLNPELALVTDVSISVPAKVIDGKGNKYISPIDHVALCVDPVVPGLKDFEAMSLSLSKGVKKMEFLKKLAEKLHLTGKEPTEESILLALDDVKPAATHVDTTTIRASVGAGVPALQVIKAIGELRTNKLSKLVQDGLVSPFNRDKIAKKYVDTAALTLELSKGDDGGFDLIVDVLNTNDLVNLEEETGHQSVELSNLSDAQPNAAMKDINKRREEAGMNVVTQW